MLQIQRECSADMPVMNSPAAPAADLHSAICIMHVTIEPAGMLSIIQSIDNTLQTTLIRQHSIKQTMIISCPSAYETHPQAVQ
jgi:hypothetical protein